MGFIVYGGLVDFDMDSLSMEKEMVKNMFEKTGKILKNGMSWLGINSFHNMVKL